MITAVPASRPTSQPCNGPAEPLPTFALKTAATPDAAQTDGFDESASSNSDSEWNVVAKPAANSYWREIDMPSKGSQQPVAPKSRLLLSDLDNTLFGPSGDNVVARLYLKIFIKYSMHPQTPFALTLWTFSGKMYEEAGLLAFWGFEDSGFLANEVMAAGKPLKNLDLMWQMLNIQTGSDWNPLNSFLVDDQVPNAVRSIHFLFFAPLDSSDASVDGDSASSTRPRSRTKERFPIEMEALDEQRGRPCPATRNKKKRLDDAVEDWELLSDDPDQTPRVVASPLYGNGENAGVARQRRDSTFD
ncbi:hypothetical protein JCM21900_006689 [Sporobolomyces salmonicolor]